VLDRLLSVKEKLKAVGDGGSRRRTTSSSAGDGRRSADVDFLTIGQHLEPTVSIAKLGTAREAHSLLTAAEH